MYSLNLLQKKNEAQILKGGALKEKSDLEFKAEALERQKAGLSSSSGSLNVELQSTQMKANLQRDYVGLLTDEATREDEEFELTKLDFEVAKLRDRIKHKGAIAVITIEKEIEHITLRVGSLDQLIIALDTRAGELPE